MAYGSEMLNAVNDIKTALGGTDDGGIEYGSELLNTVVDIKTLVENGGGGGGGLPPVSGTDNGKVLTVVDGAWAAASGGGGGGDALLEVVKTGVGVYTLGDISYNDVRALLAKGIVPIAHYTENDGQFHEFSLFYQIGYNDGTGYSVDFNDFFFNSETADGTLRYVMD